MYSREELSTMIEEYIAQLPLPGTPKTLYEPIAYSLEKGGKRLRPLLTLMSCNVFSNDVQRALPCAAAVEVFHNFTLLHDDIMDNASVRRGKPAVHRKWGVNSAILSGDAMMICSYRLLEAAAPETLPRILAVFNDTSLKVCEGQQYDMDFEAVERVSMNEYLHMISLKTSVLLAGAAVIGAITGNADEEDCKHIYAFAMNMGMAFQIKDDLLDSYGDQNSFGKKIGGDILEGKKTFLTTASMESADDDTRLKLRGLLHNKEMIADEKITRVLAIYDKLGVKRMAEDAIEKYTRLAISELEQVKTAPERVLPLKQLAQELIGRTY